MMAVPLIIHQIILLVVEVQVEQVILHQEAMEVLVVLDFNIL